MDEREMVELVDGIERIQGDIPVLVVEVGKVDPTEADVANMELKRRGSAHRVLGGVTSFTVT